MNTLLLALALALSSLQAAPPAPASAKSPAGQVSLLPRVWEVSKGVDSPTYALYDPARKAVYVSVRDGILKLSPDGKAAPVKWGQGLQEPRGLWIAKERLYAAEADNLAVVSLKNGKVLRRYPLPMAKRMSGLTGDAAGNFYVTDALEPRIQRMAPDDRWTVLSEGAPLENPSALQFHEGRLVVADKGLYALAPEGGKPPFPLNTQRGRFSGVARAAKGQWLVSDSAAGTVQALDGGNGTTLLAKGLPGCAGIAVVAPERLLIVPVKDAGKVVAYALGRFAPTESSATR